MKILSVSRLALLVFIIAIAGHPAAADPQDDGKQTPGKKGVYAVPKNGQKPPAQRREVPKASLALPALPQSAIPDARRRQTRQDNEQPSITDRNVDPGHDASPQNPRSAQPFVTERLMTQKLGPERVKRFLDNFESNMQADHGKGSSTANVWADQARVGTGVDDVHNPGGTTPVFQPVPITSREYIPSVVDAAKNVKTYGSFGGGIALEGTATGLGEINTVEYDSRFNAFILNDQVAYFVKIPPETVAVLCRAIAGDADGLIGVSVADKQIVYGKKSVYENSNLAWDLKLADQFLGNIVFAQGLDWMKGYQFAGGFKPQPREDNSIDHAVHFVFSGFQFQIEQEEMRLAHESFEVQIVPLSKEHAKDGGLIPDYNLLGKGQVYPEYEANAKHVADNISWYRRERIIDRTFAYGEVAAFIRALKKADFNLEYLAGTISGGR